MNNLVSYNRFLQTAKPKSPSLLFFGVRLCEDPDKPPTLQFELQDKLPDTLDIITRYGGVYVSVIRSTAFVQPGETLDDLEVWDRAHEQKDWEAAIRLFFERCRRSVPKDYEMCWHLGIDAAAGPTFIRFMS